MATVDFINGEVADKTTFDRYSSEHFTSSLQSIINDTKTWQMILQKQPNREWKTGFMALASWNDCYQMVIDTKGEVGRMGNILYWDFKGGGQYIIKYANFEAFLATKLALLKEKLYFPPNMEHDEAIYEDFCYGEMQEQILGIEQDINAGTKKVIDFT